MEYPKYNREKFYPVIMLNCFYNIEVVVTSSKETGYIGKKLQFTEICQKSSFL